MKVWYQQMEKKGGLEAERGESRGSAERWLCGCAASLSFPPPLSLSPSLSRHLFISGLLSVLAKLVTELLDQVGQFTRGLGFLLQELVAQAGDVLLDLFQLACEHRTRNNQSCCTHTHHKHTNRHKDQKERNTLASDKR